jgi:hypothetical protein
LQIGDAKIGGVMWSDDVIKLAIEIAGALEQGDYSEESFRKLCGELEGDETLQSFERFAVSIENVAQWQFCDSELIARCEPVPEQITNALRYSYRRKVLTGALENPIEDTPAACWEEISIAPQKSLYCCALVHIEGYSPITNWVGAYLSVKDYYSALTAAGYVTCEQDFALLDGDTLLKYWRSDESP